ncbi:MAG: type VI secretion system baseplate subunit TssE [Xanthomonadales bacterium]|jgi:type VI secretion system protein ImpF|nr:type VI secretion system baseplate subunit TssE [Xanthomonadales bacterium]
MAKLQPSLLDRLTDLRPEKEKESSSQQQLSQQEYKDAVIRDLAWLLNSAALESVIDLEDFPAVRHSVLNYGMPDISGHTSSSINTREMEKALKRAINEFEPRIIPNTLKLDVRSDPDTMSHNSLEFKIEGVVFEQPMPFQIALRSRLDLECGDFDIVEQTR